MSPRRSDSRVQMIDSATTLLRRHGASATTIERVLAHSGAPRGSVYHHFPRGRAEIIEEAVADSGDRMTAIIEETLQADDPVAAIDAFFALWRRRLIDSGFRSGCPIVAVTVDADDDAPGLTDSAGDVFVRWQEAFIELFRRHGLADDRSRRLAALVIASEEGAVVMCRAQRSAEPMEAVAGEIHDLLTRTFESTT